MTDSVLPEETQAPAAEAEEALLEAVEEAPPDPPPVHVSLTASIARDWRALTSISGLRKLYDIPLYQNAVYLMLNQVTYAASGFIFWIIAARFYSDADVGRAAALIAAVTLLMDISNLGLGFALIRFVPNREREAVPLINSALTIGGIASVVVAVIFLAGLSVWSPELKFVQDHPVFIAAFVAFSLAFTLYILLDQVFAAKRNTRPALYQALMAGLLRFPLCYIFASMFGSFGIFAAFGVAMVMSIAGSLFIFLPRIQQGYRPRPTVSSSLVGPIMARFAAINYLSNLLWAVPAVLFPIIVLNVLGPEMNAYFYIAWAVATVLFFIPRAIATSLFAEGAHSSKRLRLNAAKAAKLTLLLMVPITGLVLLLARWILSIFGSAYSEHATSLLLVLVVSTLPVSVNHMVMTILRVTNNLKGLLVVSLSMAVATIGLAYFFMQEHGILGVGLGWLVAQAAVALLGIAVVYLHARLPAPDAPMEER